MTAVGLPHSGTPGSWPARGSPGRIVVRHALRRLSAPRHPPIALGSLITLNGSSGMPALAGGANAPQPHAGSKAPLCIPDKAYPSSCLQFSRCPIKESSNSPEAERAEARSLPLLATFNSLHPYYGCSGDDYYTSGLRRRQDLCLTLVRNLVEASGLEPLTYCVQSNRSPN